MRFKELELITAATFLDLLDYHEQCRAAAVSLLSSPDYWINCDEDFAPMFEPHSRSKKCCTETNIMYFGTIATISNDGWPVVSKRGVPYRMKMWAAEYLEQLGDFAGDCKNPLLPIRALVSNLDAAARAVKSASECPRCSERVVQCILQFTQVAEAAVDETISSVSLVVISAIHWSLIHMAVDLSQDRHLVYSSASTEAFTPDYNSPLTTRISRTLTTPCTRYTYYCQTILALLHFIVMSKRVPSSSNTLSLSPFFHQSQHTLPQPNTRGTA